MIQVQTILLPLLILVSCVSKRLEDSTSKDFADVTKVTASGSENSYRFNVTLSSPDTGCDQYADWLEVVSESGELIYRRILLHSHVNEQPFIRSGGLVAIAKNQTVWVRAHMNNTGYGGVSVRGSIEDGFSAAEFPDSIGEGLDQVEPLPGDCNF